MGVVVLGMHRGGTSATTRAVHLLGVPLGDVRDWMQPRGDNPRGFWESESLTALNDEILEALGGHWTAPPASRDCLAGQPRLSSFRERAVERIRAVYTTRRWVWKDPRLCITLPFWLSLLEPAPVFVIAQRNPLEIAASLEARNGFSKVFSLALWERYVRSALEHAQRRPAFVVHFVDLLSDPARCLQELQDFLVRHDAVDGAGTPHAEITREVDVDLRHHVRATASFQEDRDASDEQKELNEVVERLVGAHERLVVPRLPDETAWAAELIEERRERLRLEHRDAAIAETQRRRIELLVEQHDDLVRRSAEEERRLSTLIEMRDDLIVKQEARLERLRLSLPGRLVRRIVGSPSRRGGAD